MIIGILKEPSFETRVSLLAESSAALIKKGNKIIVESGAGEKSFNSNLEYEKIGAEIKSRTEVLEQAEILLSIHPLLDDDFSKINSKILLGVHQPLSNGENVIKSIERKLTTFSLDMLPRTTRAQAMDVLSSQANIAGYKAVLLAANSYGRYFPMFMTAAGSIAPAKVLILGAGVAGLQAIATAKRL
ncbi:MAG: NAD(P)(+) transhydrogenase (Re/Si-specific) subunit alpha, partial [Cloacibacterium sp.]|nr:NAD(P)(+) transhydrogenase (Re/Si-specific) subunit alpha [Cloacibacterium sp.]